MWLLMAGGFICGLIGLTNAQKSSWLPSGNNTILILDQTYSGYYFTGCNSYTYFSVYFYYPCNDLTVSLLSKEGGSPEMYISRANLDNDPYPTKDKMTWAGTSSNHYSVTISRWDPESAPGYYYIGVYNDCSKRNSTAMYQIQAVKDTPNMFDDQYTTNPSALDVLYYPMLTRNLVIEPNTYKYFRFCVPRCSNVEVSVQTSSSTVYPRLVVSRTETYPTLQSLGYKVTNAAGPGRRNLTISASDPSGRDRNGNNQGSYYIAVHGSCPPGVVACNLVNANKIKFTLNITLGAVAGLSIFGRDWGRCPAFSAIVPPTEPIYPILTAGSTATPAAAVTDTVTCSNGIADYKYYRLPAANPCVSTTFVLRTTGGGGTGVATMVASRYPNTAPRTDRLSLTWTAGGSMDTQSLGISVWDPNFDGGDVCGPSGSTLCYLYVGVTGSCAAGSTGNTTIRFQLSTTVAPALGVMAVPQLNQTVTANGVKSYRFCAADPTQDVALQLSSHTSACACPDSYALYDVVVSKYNPNAAFNDLSWKVRGGSAGRLNLPCVDADTRPGSYYVNVLGTCASAGTVQGVWQDPCTSGPCANLRDGRSPFHLLVAGSTSTAAGGPSPFEAGVGAVAMGACRIRNATMTAGSKGTCGATCPVSLAAKAASAGGSGALTTYAGLSDAGKTAIAVVFVLLFLLVAGCCLWRNKMKTHAPFTPDDNVRTMLWFIATVLRCSWMPKILFNDSDRDGGRGDVNASPSFPFPVVPSIPLPPATYPLSLISSPTGCVDATRLPPTGQSAREPRLRGPRRVPLRRHPDVQERGAQAGRHCVLKRESGRGSSANRGDGIGETGRGEETDRGKRARQREAASERDAMLLTDCLTAVTMQCQCRGCKGAEHRV